MKIAHLVYTPRLSGAEVLVSLLLPAHLGNGHSVALMSMNPTQASFEPIQKQLSAQEVKIYIPNVQLSRFARIMHLRHALHEFNPDMIFAHSIIPSAYVRWVTKSMGIPVVTVLHDATRDDYKSWIYQIAERILPAPDYVVGVADEALANYRRRFSGKIPGSVVENAIDLNGLKHAQLNRDNFRSEVLRLSVAEKLFVSVGRFSKQKNQELLIQAFAAMPAQDLAQSRLLLVGITEDRVYEKRLRGIASGLGDRVLFLADRPDSLQILACADVYCMPSLHEGFSLAFLEGMALGVRVLASDIPAFRFAKEWDGVDLVALTDSKLWTASMHAAVSKMPIHYIRSLDKFAPSAVAEQYEAIAHQVNRSTSLRT